MPALHVWMNGELVGVWATSRSGIPTFRYEPQWISSASARALSLSLPITAGQSEHRGHVVANYFDNLLPDSADIRRRVGARFRTPSTAPFDLLAAIGRDCVGAVQLLPEGAEPQGWNRVDSEVLTEEEVERILLDTTAEAPLGQRSGEAGFRISIAGAQEKTALLRLGGHWHRPHGATPTTHILKLPLGLVGNMRADLTDSVENEWLCAQILGEMGLRVAATQMARFGRQKVLVVERFDRRWQERAREATWIARLPQEDMCQATGTAPTLKYESDGGPSMRTCLDVLAGSDQAGEDQAHFVLSQLAFWLLAATDGHAKNFSLFHQHGGTFRLTPLYDVISAWPVIGDGPNLIPYHDARSAMALRSRSAHYCLREVRARHWRALAERSGAEASWTRMIEMAAGVDAALGRVRARVPDDFPVRVWSTIEAGTKRHAGQFLDEVAPR